MEKYLVRKSGHVSPSPTGSCYSQTQPGSGSQVPPDSSALPPGSSSPDSPLVSGSGSLFSSPPTGSCSQVSPPNPETRREFSYRTPVSRPSSSMLPVSRTLNPKTPNSSLQKSTEKLKDATPKSANSKTSWTIIYVKMGGKIQMHIFCRKSNGSSGLVHTHLLSLLPNEDQSGSRSLPVSSR